VPVGLIELTPIEYKLLHYLLATQGESVTGAKSRPRVAVHISGNATCWKLTISYVRQKVDPEGALYPTCAVSATASGWPQARGQVIA